MPSKKGSEAAKKAWATRRKLEAESERNNGQLRADSTRQAKTLKEQLREQREADRKWREERDEAERQEALRILEAMEKAYQERGE